MFPSRFFCRRFFAARFFPKIGATPVFNPWWALGANKTIGIYIEPE